MNNYETLRRIRDHIIVGKRVAEDIEDLNTILNMMDKQPLFFILDDTEASALWDYFLNRAGVISHEFDEPIHAICKRLKDFVE